MLERKLFSRLKVGDNNVEVKLLQFMDDTLFLCDSNIQNIHSIKVMLRCFEICFGLRVNFFKRKIGVVGVNRIMLDSFSEVLQCSIMNIPFIYLVLLQEVTQLRQLFGTRCYQRLRRYYQCGNVKIYPLFYNVTSCEVGVPRKSKIAWNQADRLIH